MIRRNGMDVLACLALLLVAMPAVAEDEGEAEAEAERERRTLAFWNFDERTLEPAAGEGQMRHELSSVAFFSGTDVNVNGPMPEAEPDEEEHPSQRSASEEGSAGSEDGEGDGEADRDADEGAAQDNHALAIVGGAGTEPNGSGGHNGKSLYFLIDTRGYTDLEVSLAARRTSEGFRRNHLAYSLNNGRTFTSLDASFEPGEEFAEHVFDLSEVRRLNNQRQLVIRIVFTGATHSQGNNRIDNLRFTARPIERAN